MAITARVLQAVLVIVERGADLGPELPDDIIESPLASLTLSICCGLVIDRFVKLIEISDFIGLHGLFHLSLRSR